MLFSGMANAVFEIASMSLKKPYFTFTVDKECTFWSNRKEVDTIYKGFVGRILPLHLLRQSNRSLHRLPFYPRLSIFSCALPECARTGNRGPT